MYKKKKGKRKERRNCFLCKRARLYFYGPYLLTLAIFPACCTALHLAGSPPKWNNISEKVGILIVWHGQGKLQPSKLLTSHVSLQPGPELPLHCIPRCIEVTISCNIEPDPAHELQSGDFNLSFLLKAPVCWILGKISSQKEWYWNRLPRVPRWWKVFRNHVDVALRDMIWRAWW